MDRFIEAIRKVITAPGKQLSIVRNKGGFLLRDDTLEHLRNESGLEIITGSQLALRVHFETIYKRRSLDDDRTYCYIIDDIDTVLPDMLEEAHVCSFHFTDLLREYESEQLKFMENPIYDVIAHLYKHKPTRDLSSEETAECVRDAWDRHGFDSYLENGKLSRLNPDWQKADDADKIFSAYSDAVSKGREESIKQQIERLNQDFQKKCIMGYYGGMRSRSEQLPPKIVSKILPYINYAHSSLDKVALLVIDCMSYWQYLILRDNLLKLGIETQDDIVYSWLPSLTELSRQAIFRGDSPKPKYAQSPQSEEKLWKTFWKEHQISLLDFQIAYQYGGKIDKNHDEMRFGYVDITLDESAHGDVQLRFLYDETVHWAEDKAHEIKHLVDAGYHVYITADHGNLWCKGWKNIKVRSEDVLLQDGEVSQRCLKFKNANTRIDQYLEDNPEIKDEVWHQRYLAADDYLLMSGNRCFSQKDMITHGGTHFMEVIVPFAHIKPRT